MDDGARSVRLDVRFEGGSPAGRATAHGGRSRGFAGWLGLMAAVEALVGDEAAPDGAWTSGEQECTDE